MAKYFFTTTRSAHLRLRLGFRRLVLERKIFSDGNLYLRLRRNVAGREVLLIGSVQSADDLLELLFAVRAVKENGGRPKLCIPYLGYSRADRREFPGELNRMKLMADVLNILHVPVRLMDLHRSETLKFFRQAKHLSALPLLARALRRDHAFAKNAVVVSPDRGGRGRAKLMARLVGAGRSIVLQKKRRGERVSFHRPTISLRGKTVLIVDDILDTGQTLFGAARLLKRLGAEKIFAVVVHGVFSRRAWADLARSPISALYVTNSLPIARRTKKLKVVDITPLFKKKTAT